MGHSHLLYALKHLPLLVLGIGACKSGKKSPLRIPFSSDKVWQATLQLVTLRNLIQSADLPLDSFPRKGNGKFKPCAATSMYCCATMTGLQYNSSLVYVLQGPSCNYDGNFGTMGTPKVENGYGCGGFVRKPGYRYFSSNSHINFNKCVGLKELMETNKNNTEHINNGLIHLISDVNLLILAYESIKSKPGNMTPGVDSTTLDKLDLNWFNYISKDLLAGRFKFKPARRVHVPKPGKKLKDH